ncbi:hypothetical protein ACLOJK_011288 [Asimina triloba]
MDSDQGKLFIGGISWDTSEENLKAYFQNYGDVSQAVIMRDKVSGRPRGFGFVVFQDPAVLDRVLQDKHTIDGRTVLRIGADNGWLVFVSGAVLGHTTQKKLISIWDDSVVHLGESDLIGLSINLPFSGGFMKCKVEAKRALSREEHQNNSRSGNPNSGRSSGGGGSIKTKKIFVGGLPPTLTEDGFRQYFENYGQVTDVVIMYDQNTQRPRGFGFISFDTEDAVDRVLHKSFHDLGGKLVEVKRALPKEANPGSSGRSMVGGGYQGYGGSGVNSSGYDGRMDTNRYMQPQTAGGGYPPYGSSGYGGPGYGYGAPNSAVGYGGYSGYGGANAGYGGPAGTYGNPNAPAAGYVGGAPGSARNLWNNQAPGGYPSSGYGAGYGAAPAWNAAGSGAAAGSGGPVSAPAGQSPSGATAYGSQGYYGSYGGHEGSYANAGGYGASGGRATNAPGGGDQQGASAGYMGGGYGDANGNPAYANSGWRDSPQDGTYGAQGNGPSGGQVSYGTGYGGAQSRQAQQQ